ncbi:tyrosine-type recombinase/integrase [Bradyrhizobium sp. SZCCHNR1020]|uniref:tyrosine-type recombinase/integrase n=1 Tax=Bradyrhizobium sp. SZCCHNR1020 TaxID=3057343 RepID=UPI002915E482|nr:tyrosine-type recombinase/integrase [Bradyrhizobium sp. SZCCHNR1020]
MPLVLRPPRAGKTPNYEIRGTYRGIHVEVTSGTTKRSVALDRLREIERCIEQHGQWPAPEPEAGPTEPTFLTATEDYLRAGGRRKYLAALVRHFGPTKLSDMTQARIDAAALALYPNVSPATRNGYVYTPVSAVMHHALGDACPVIRRPKGAKGNVKTDFLWPDDAFAIIDQAEQIDAEFGLYLLLLIYTGIRKGEGLSIARADVQPDELAAWLRTSKNEDPRMLRLREDLARRLAVHLARSSGERLFRFNDGGHFKHLLTRAKLAACGLPCPKRRPTGWTPPDYRLAFVGFHTFRHTWATWMRRYGGADVQGLAETKNWRDPRSAARYAHVVAREEWQRVDNLPAPGKIRGKAVND